MPRGKILLLAGGASINNATFTGQSLFADGTKALPSIAFTTAPTVGFSWNNGGNSQLAASANGAAIWATDTTSFRFASQMQLQWSSGDPTTTASDLAVSRGGTGTLYIASSNSLTDNTGILGDATHRLTQIHTKTVTIGQSIANPVMGVVTLSGGTGTASVQTTAVAANCRIFLTHQNAAGTTGTARVTSSTIGTGFTIVSSSSTDTSTIGWFIFLAS